MSITVEDVARQVLAALDSDAGYLIAAQWVVNRYEQLATRTRMRHLRQVGEVIMPAAVTAGTATLTRDSQVVTSNATAQAAWLAIAESLAQGGWFIRAKVAWYEVVSLQNGELRLRNDYAEDTSTAGAYHLVRRYLPLDARAQHLGDTFVHMRRRLPIRRITIEDLDLMAPSRPRVGTGPDHVGEAPEFTDGTKAIEAYPYSTTSESLRYVYWTFVDSLKLTDRLPPRIAGYALKEGALIDLFRYKAARAADKNQIETAAFWRNESRAQETKWEQYLREIVANDRGGDDAQFILQRAGASPRAFDIRDAQDEVYARWPR